MALKEISTHEPAWDIARLFPDQGAWSVEDYLALDTNHLVEYSHGSVEVLPMPSQSHQFIVFYLCMLLREFIQVDQLGVALVSPLRVRLWEGKFREPDVIFMLAEHAHRRGESYWRGADLVMEVISPDNPSRDTRTKRREYAQAGIPEYWLIDPRAQQIMVLTLVDQQYELHGLFNPGEQATSLLLEGFYVSVRQVFAQDQ